MTFKLSQTSLNKMAGVHPALIEVMKLAITLSKVDFRITEGRRSTQRQRELLKAGATATLNSRHLTGHAVDVAALVNGKVRWDWPLYYSIAGAVKTAAKKLNVPIEWGGDWKSFKDGPHFQLPWKQYPKGT